MSDIDWWSLRYEQVNSQLICPICQTALVSPTTTPCGHTFCKKCIESLAETSEIFRCPIDRRAIDVEHLKPAPFLVSGLVNDLVVYCPHEQCSFKDKRWLLQSHIDLHCEYALIPCHEPCDKLCERRWFQKGKCCHESVDCPNDCRQTIAMTDLEEHLLKCPKAAFTCPHCDESFPSSDKEQHLEECPDHPVYCPGKQVGCPFETVRSAGNLDAHTVVCPLALLSPMLAQQQEKIESLERESQVLKRQLENTKRQVKRDAANLDMHILIEYDRMRTDLDHAMTQNDSNMKQMMMLARENLQMSEDVGFLKNSLVSLRHQVHHSMQRRFNMPIHPFFMERPEMRQDPMRQEQMRSEQMRPEHFEEPGVKL